MLLSLVFREFFFFFSFYSFLYMAQQPLVHQGLLTVEGSRSLTRQTRCESSGPVLRLDTETSTLQHTVLTRDRHPSPRRDSNPQFQQKSRRRPTP